MARWFTWTVSREVRGVVRKGVLGGLRAQPPTRPGLPDGLSTGPASLTGGHCDGPSRLVDNSTRPASRRRGPGPNGGAGRPSPAHAHTARLATTSRTPPGHVRPSRSGHGPGTPSAGARPALSRRGYGCRVSLRAHIARLVAAL